MNIPDKAVEAARNAVYAHVSTAERPDWIVAVKAAARFIAAQALREAADKLADIDFEPEDANTPADVGVIASAKDLRKWADELGPQ